MSGTALSGARCLLLCAAMCCSCNKDGEAQGRERVDERSTETSASVAVDPSDEGAVDTRPLVEVLMEASARLHKAFFIQRDASRSVRCSELEIPKHPSADRLQAALTTLGFDVTTTEHGWMIDGAIADARRACDGPTIAVIDRGIVTEAGPAKRPSSRRTTSPRSTRETLVTEEEAMAAVKQLGPEEREVGPNAVDYLRFSNRALPRVIPADEGMRLYGVRSTGLLASLGLRNGDVLVSFNGTRLDDWEKALLILVDPAIPAPSKVKLQVQRQGSAVELSYTIVPGPPTPGAATPPTAVPSGSASGAPSVPALPLPPRPRRPRPIPAPR